MKSKLIALGLIGALVTIAISQVFASRAYFRAKPEISISEALRIAENHLITQKIPTTDHYISNISLHRKGVEDDMFQKDDRDAWLIDWEPTAETRHASPFVIVYMDKTVKVLYSK
jgi:hypothetical protein